MDKILTEYKNIYHPSLLFSLRLTIYLLFAGLVVLIGGCSNNEIYSETKTFQNNTWTYRDSLAFAFEIKDTSEKYTIELDITHLDSFQYQNLYVKIHSLYPGGTQKYDVLSLEFADDLSQWMGKRSGDRIVAPIGLQPVARFKEAGLYKMVFYQNSRRDSLGGLHSAKLKVLRIGG